MFFAISVSSNFNPRTREGCDFSLYQAGLQQLHFNPRTREGCDVIITIKHFRHVYFNPRTREGCDFETFRLFVYSFKFQSTHPRGVRPNQPFFLCFLTTISIHAPARGATNVCLPSVQPQDYFNPRTREGCDPVCDYCGEPVQDISIHAPARGATANINKFKSNYDQILSILAQKNSNSFNQLLEKTNLNHNYYTFIRANRPDNLCIHGVRTVHIRISKYHLLFLPFLLRYDLLLFCSYFQDNRIGDCLFLYQLCLQEFV